MQMVNLMLKDARQPVIDLVAYFVAMTILGPHNQLCRPIYICRQARNAQATLLGDFGAFGFNDLRVNQFIDAFGFFGTIFVFVLSIGNFITPDLLGGGRRVMVGNLIDKQFLAARDWPFGSALAFLLIAVMMLLLFAQALVVRKSGGERPA